MSPRRPGARATAARVHDAGSSDDPATAPPAEFRWAFDEYIGSRRMKVAASTVNNDSSYLSAMLSAPGIVAGLVEPGVGLLSTVHKWARTRWCGDVALNAAATFRRWYLWSTDIGMAGFDADVATHMEATSVASPIPGAAVMSLDEDRGPLTETEAQAFEAALWEAARRETLPLILVVAGLLLLALGCNPENLIRLDERDLVVQGAGAPTYVLQVPRIKKRLPASARKSRALDPALGRLVQRLIDENRADHPPDAAADGKFGRPLFRRTRPAKQLVGTACEGGALRVNNHWFGTVASSLPAMLRDLGYMGSITRVHCRRLRYTFARRAVAAGVTEEQLMELLDHSNKATLMVYFNPGFELVDRLDRAMDGRLRAIAAAFDGSGSLAALRGALDWEHRSLESRLGLPGVCLDCLSCRKFRPSDAVALRRVSGALTDLADLSAEDRATADGLAGLAQAAAAAVEASGARGAGRRP